MIFPWIFNSLYELARPHDAWSIFLGSYYLVCPRKVSYLLQHWESVFCTPHPLCICSDDPTCSLPSCCFSSPVPVGNLSVFLAEASPLSYPKLSFQLLCFFFYVIKSSLPPVLAPSPKHVQKLLFLLSFKKDPVCLLSFFPITIPWFPFLYITQWPAFIHFLSPSSAFCPGRLSSLALSLGRPWDSSSECPSPLHSFLR